MYRKFKPLFFWLELYRRTRELSISFLFDENPSVASVGLGGAAVGRARSVPDRAARSHSERAAQSVSVGNRVLALRLSTIDRNRCAGERGGARVGRPKWLRILITGGSSMAAMIFKLPPPVRAVLDVDVEDPFEQPGPTQARRRTLRVHVIG